MERFLPFRAVIVLVTALCVGLLAFAFSSQGETSKVVGTHKAVSENVHIDALGNVRPGHGTHFANRNAVFRYRSWKVFGVDVWTWEGEYWEVWGKAEHPLTRDEVEGGYRSSSGTPVKFDDVPAEYRTPLGWFIFGSLAILCVLVIVVSCWPRRRTGGDAGTAEPVAAPDRRA